MVSLQTFPTAFVAAVATLLFLAQAPAPVTPLTQEQIKLVERIIYTDFMPQGKVPGMAISIVHGDQVYSAGHGYANRERGIPATNETLFAVGSLSKMLSSVFIVHFLSERFPELGEAVLDIPIRQLAPNFDLVLSDRYRTEYITFRDILSHKVCLVDAPLQLYTIAGGSNKSDVIYQRRFAPEYCHFRSSQISYSNVMIPVAAEAVASIAGDDLTFEELVIAFYRRMGMRGIRFINDNDNYAELPHMSQPYYFKDGVLNPMNPELIKYVSPIPAGGGVLLNSNDMVHYMKFILNRGKVGGVQLVKEEVIDWITRISTSYKFDGYRGSPSPGAKGNLPFGQLGYGLGMMVDVYDWYQMIGHQGAVSPYTSLVSMLPALDIGVFTTVNGPGSEPLPNHYTIQFQLIESLMADLEPNRAQLDYRSVTNMPRIETEFDLLKTQTVSEIRPVLPGTEVRLHEDIVGRYGAPLQGEFNITNVDSRTLYFHYGRWATGFLNQRPATPTIYDLQFDSDLPQHYYSYGFPIAPPTFLDFSTPGAARLNFIGQDFWFEKDWSLEQEPVVPWEPDSCGPRS